MKGGKFVCGASLNYILTLSMINFSQTLMDFSGCLCCSLGYNEGLSQSFYVDFPCGYECITMRNIKLIQDNFIKTERKEEEMITLNMV